MEEKLNEILVEEIEKTITDRQKDKRQVEEELGKYEGKITSIGSEKENLDKDLEKINKELEDAISDNNTVKEAEEFKKNRRELKTRLENLNKEKKELEVALYDVKSKREYKDGKLVPTSEEQKILSDLTKINNEVQDISEKINNKSKKFEQEIENLYIKYKVREKYSKRESKDNKDTGTKKDDNLKKDEDKTTTETENKDNLKGETVTFEELGKAKSQQDYEKIMKTAIDGTYREVKQGKSQQPKKDEEKIEKDDSKAEKIDLFDSIEVNANEQTIKLLYRDSKNDKEIPIKEALDSKSSLYKRIDLKREIADYCENEQIGLFKKIKLSRRIDPAIVSAISYYGGEDDLYIYFDSLAKSEELQFGIHYNLTDSNLDNKSFNTLNKYAKRDRNIEGITAEGVKENLLKRLIKGVKQGNLLKAFEKPKQIAASGVKKVKETGDNVVNKAKTTRDNVVNKAKTTRDNTVNKAADKMIKLADKIRVDGHAEEVAKKYNENQDKQNAQAKTEPEKTEHEAQEK